jgi:hypothetical protein
MKEANEAQLETPGQYRAFLLRMWQAGNTGWQASLHDAATNERIGFDSLEALFNFLLSEAERAKPSNLTRPASATPARLDDLTT